MSVHVRITPMTDMVRGGGFFRNYFLKKYDFFKRKFSNKIEKNRLNFFKNFFKKGKTFEKISKEEKKKTSERNNKISQKKERTIEKNCIIF